MMDAQLDDIRERGEPIAALWASEETIYGRYGYGLASLGLYASAERDAVRVRASERRRRGSWIATRHCEPAGASTTASRGRGPA